MRLRKEHVIPPHLDAQRIIEKRDMTDNSGGIPKKGSHRRKYIAAVQKDGKEYFLHATKGWRAFTA
jgi:hypothetical protein